MPTSQPTDPHFPVLHRVHPQGWVNDPNGVLHLDGRWHVHFQYNPSSARHERIRWGHMSSEDLVTWQVEPVGPEPREGEADAGGCWSGVALSDPARGGDPVLVYSGVDGVHDELARVLLARPSRDLRCLPEPGRVVADVPEGLDLVGVRDPFVFEAFGRRWAIQGTGLTADAQSGGAATPALLLYSCDDLENWEYRGQLLTGADAVAAQHAPAEIWECPQLVQLGEDWVLLLSLWTAERPGVPAASPRTVHLVGSLEQDERGLPRFVARTGGPIDAGPDIYAPQAVQDRENDRVLMWGWSWEGASRTPEQADAQGWAGCLTLPRELVLVGDELLAHVPRELDALRAGEMLVIGNAVEVPAPARLEVRAPHGARLEILDAGGATRESLDLNGAMRILVDGSIIEAIGERTLPHTQRLYPEIGERVRLSGQELQAWNLRVPQA